MKKLYKMSRQVIDLVEIEIDEYEDINNCPYTVIENLDVLNTEIIEEVM